MTNANNNTHQTSEQVRKSSRELTENELVRVLGGRIYRITPADQTMRALIR
jgi:hypothetical protein